jgi:hypothetical protein
MLLRAAGFLSCRIVRPADEHDRLSFKSGKLRSIGPFYPR